MKKVLILSCIITALVVYAAKKPLLYGPGSHPLSTQGSSILPSSAGGDLADALSLASLPAESVVVMEGAIAKRSSFYVEMQKQGVSPVEIDRIVRATKGTFDLKKVRPGQKYTIYSTETGGLDSLEYLISREKILKIRKADETYAAVIDTLPYRIVYKVTSGTIEGSLFLSLQREGADEALASHLSIIFGWVIDFFKDIRKGDTYTILYEKKVFEDGVEHLGNILAANITTQNTPYHALRYMTANENWGYYDLEGKSLQKTLLRAPLKFSRITSSFKHKRLHPVTRVNRPHYGVDYAAPYGTPVVATGDGTVIAAQHNNANGKYVKLRHNRSYTTYYLHLSRFGKGVREGTRVRQGQVIGYVGSTGLATGPHLDYRIKLNGSFVNPRTVKLPSKDPVPAAEMALFKMQRDAAMARLIEAIGEGSEGRTVLVEKPAYQTNGKREEAF
jgi:murein DD-endopeptidase MepM/ murein hydrolase activator NlpD